MTGDPRVRRFAGAVVVALAVLAYAAALAGTYVFDDVHSVAANPALQDPAQFGRLFTDPSAFSSTGQRMYRPVLLASFAVNTWVSGAAWSLKAGNVLVHALVAWLLFGWLRQNRLGAAAAGLGAALFAVHPLAAEAVNLVSARSELLLVAGLLLALRAQLAYLRGTRGVTALGTLLVGALLACGSKETGAVLPALLVAQSWCWRQGPERRARWGRAVHSVLVAAVLVAGYLVVRKLLLGQATVPLLGRTGGDPGSGHGRTLLTQLATMGGLLPRALLQAVVPLGTSFDPPVVYRHGFADPVVVAGWLGVVGATAAGLWPGRRPAVRLGVVLAWATALPWVLIPLNMPLAEHRLYGPLAGLAAVAAAAWPRRVARRLPVGVAAAAGLVLAVAGGGAALRSLAYRDEVTLWLAELEHQPFAWRAWWGLGAARLRGGDVEGAVEPLANAQALYPQHLAVHRHYAEALVQRTDQCAEPLRSLVVTAALAARQPSDPWVRTLSAQACLQAGRVLGSREHFLAAETHALACLQLAPAKGYVFRLAAAARRGLGEPAAALAHLDQSLRQGLDHFTVRLDRAAVLRELGRHRDAQRELLRAQQQAPTDPQVLQALQSFAAAPR